ncbi:MAG TPA: FAD-dependent oxidoreductase [Roseiflexaceae bacterium]|nr:FAD-dependent oxidoreductase [Roseiflexaceae bacterium]
MDDPSFEQIPPASYWQTTARRSGVQPADLPTSVDVAVVGGGLLGTAATYWLARLGARVALLEAHTLAAGATGRNGGFMVAGTAEAYPTAIARHGHAVAHAVWSLTLESRTLLRNVLAEEAIACDYREPGLLHLALGDAQREHLAQTVAALHADGFAGELLDRQQTQDLVGTPLGPEIIGALFAPEDGLLHSARLVYGLAAAAARHGALICEATRVVGLQSGAPDSSPSDAGVTIRTTRGQVRAKAAIVAINAWSDELAPGLAGSITPVRGQVLAYAPSAPVFRCGMGAAVTPTGEYWQQTPDGTIVLGGARAAAPDAEVGLRALDTTVEVQSAIEQLFPRLFPALRGLQVAQRWAGLMGFTADGLPIADRAPGLPGVWVVGGFCGHGMPFGMRLGQLLASAATAGAAPNELMPFRIDR